MSGPVPATLHQPGALTFWMVVFLTGVGAGVSAVLLTLLLNTVQRLVWPGSGTLVDVVARAAAWQHLLVLTAAGLLTGLGQAVLVRLTSGNGIDITAAIWFSSGRLPALRTLGSALLSVVIVGMGASLGREGAPKQAGALLANALADRGRLSEEQRRLLVACGAGAGMAAAYGVPLGGALFSLEVLRGMLSLRLVLPALMTSLVAAAVSWLVLPNAPTYLISDRPSSPALAVWALLAGPVAGLASVGYVRLITWADRHKPGGRLRLVSPALALGLLGLVSVEFPQLLGNGKDTAQQAFSGQLSFELLLALLLLKPLATALCLGSGAPGGLFTPSLMAGAMLGGVLGHIWSWFAPGVPVGACAVVGATAVLAATTQGPISAVVLMMELTGQDRSFILPLLVGVVTATLVSRSIDPRSIYDAQLSDVQLAERLRLREQGPQQA